MKIKLKEGINLGMLVSENTKVFMGEPSLEIVCHTVAIDPKGRISNSPGEYYHDPINTLTFCQRWHIDKYTHKDRAYFKMYMDAFDPEYEVVAETAKLMKWVNTKLMKMEESFGTTNNFGVYIQRVCLILKVQKIVKYIHREPGYDHCTFNHLSIPEGTKYIQSIPETNEDWLRIKVR